MAGFRNSILGGINLIRAAIRSPNYVQGSSGWTINQDGSAEFNNLVVRGVFSGTDFVVNSAGIFLYSGTPALGNMTGSWAAAAGTDAYGNSFPAGLEVYGGALGSVLIDPTDGRLVSTGSSAAQVVLGDGAITMNEPIQVNSALIEQNLRALRGSLWITGGNQATTDRRTALELVTTTGFPVAGTTDSFPRLSINNPNGDVATNAYVSGAVVKSSDLGATTAEVWQVPGQPSMPPLGSGWASGPSGGTVQACQYRRDAEDNLVITGTVHTTSTTPASTIFTLPAAYRPKITQRCVGVSNSGGTPTVRYLEINSSGAVSANPALTTTSTDVYFAVCVPLGNIS